MRERKSDVYVAMFNQLNGTRDENLRSPAQRLFNRTTKRTFQIHRDALNPLLKADVQSKILGS